LKIPKFIFDYHRLVFQENNYSLLWNQKLPQFIVSTFLLKNFKELELDLRCPGKAPNL
jgi:hypothetical protein